MPNPELANLPSTIHRKILLTFLSTFLSIHNEELTNVLLSGKHTLIDGKLTTIWKLSPTFSRIYEPDIRSTAYEFTDFGRYEIRPSVGAVATRDWRELNGSKL